MYGTVMIAKLKGSLEDLRQIEKEWEAEYPAKGFVGQDILVGDDGETVVSIVRFASKAEYVALADNPKQDDWWRTKMQPLLGDDVQWIDGEWELGAR